MLKAGIFEQLLKLVCSYDKLWYVCIIDTRESINTSRPSSVDLNLLIRSGIQNLLIQTCLSYPKIDTKCLHTLTYTQDTFIHSLILIHTHLHTSTCTHSHTFTHTLTRILSLTHTCFHSHTHTYTSLASSWRLKSFSIFNIYQIFYI